MSEPTSPRDELVTLLIDYLDAREWYDGTGSTERFVEAIHLAEVLLAAGWTKVTSTTNPDDGGCPCYLFRREGEDDWHGEFCEAKP
ncbi:hypothetical protein [Aeromicrobium sp. HA]|uniref:hypothetical protein n=1 Tax=Aeromicrobium sp. HA TaxID=3009077 RepID=UPI0022B062A4|nr:hypothetical protein [Aeromicrobium sp. HA]